MSRPMEIKTSPGECIQLRLGTTGFNYLFITHSDNGTTVTETQLWSANTLPFGLSRQLDSIERKGRLTEAVAFGSNEAWYVSGKFPNGSGHHRWWSEGQSSGDWGDYIKSSDNFRFISFGPDETFVAITGNNGYKTSGNLPGGLMQRMEWARKHGLKINKISLFPNGGSFIRDSNDTKWGGLGSTNLNKWLYSGRDNILDVQMSSDGSWIIIRPTRFEASNGICKDLLRHLRDFYREENSRRMQRARLIEEFDQFLLAQEMAILERLKKKLKQEQIKKEKERKRMEAMEQGIAKRNTEARLLTVRAKQLKIGDLVSIIDFSEQDGDSVVKSIRDDGVIIAARVKNALNTITIDDPKRLVIHQPASVESFNILVFSQATDKYEAAVSLFLCQCVQNTCMCKKIGGLSFNNRDFGASMLNGISSLDSGFTSQSNSGYKHTMASILGNHSHKSLLQSPSAFVKYLPVREEMQGIQPFDEYRCTEKIDMTGLENVLRDLTSDAPRRNQVMVGLSNATTTEEKECLKKLQRCHEMGLVAEALFGMLKEYPRDKNGCVVYEVEYQHKDASSRGRLFAVGNQVKVSEEKYPRTTTLQGMHSDLRNPLVGSFAHDIDCENSEVRLLCSIAAQLNLSELVPKLQDYRDNRRTWLQRISKLHDLKMDDAKRLPNIIINGGTYDTWLKLFNRKKPLRTEGESREVSKFLLGLTYEVRALRDELLQHPRFRWTAVDREKLLENGKRGGQIEIALVPRIIQYCENEVLSIIHRYFFKQGWRVRAKVFDGLIVEPGFGLSGQLNELILGAQQKCLENGWEVYLVEKPLHGLQNAPLASIVDARKAMRLI